MLSPIERISFKVANLRQLRKAKNTNQNKSVNINLENSIYSKGINFKGYPIVDNGVSFNETLKRNYFQLPQVKLSDGSMYQLRPDESQLECAKRIYNGDSLVFCAPTGTGKTAVAHYAISKNLSQNKKTIYATPLKALANDKLREFRKIYGEENVGLLTGDIKLNTNAPIQIMTTEIYNNQAPQLSKNAHNIATVIFDEAHYINDKDRGNVWENSIINTPQSKIQIICLSATIGNSEDFTGWIQKLNPSKNVSKVEVSPTERFVPLVWEIYQPDKKQNSIGRFIPISHGQIKLDTIDSDNLTSKQKRAIEILYRAENQIEGYFEIDKDSYKAYAEMFKSALEQDISKNGNHILNNFEGLLTQTFPVLNKNQAKEIANLLLDDETKTINKIHVPNEEDNYEALIEALRRQDKLPALIFKLSEKGCQRVCMNLKENGVDLTTKEEKEQIESIINEYQKQGLYLGVKFDKEMLLKGYGYHNAAMLPQTRKLVEELFAKKLLKVAVATSTLSAGINMPTRTVVMTNTSYKKFNPKTNEVEFNYLTASDFHQMAGRAGRRGVDSLGYVVLYNLQTPQEGFKTDILAQLSKGDDSKSKKEFDKRPDELGLAYELLESDANNLRSHYKPDWCLLAQYLRDNQTNDNLQNIINSSFKVHLSKNPQKDLNSMLNKFKNYETVLLKQGFIEKDFKVNMILTPKGELLSMCQGANPLLLANLIYDEKLDGLMMENLCQAVGYVSGSSEQVEHEDLRQIIQDRLNTIFSKDLFEAQYKETYSEVQKTLDEQNSTITRHLREAKLPVEDIKMSESFSGFATFVFSCLNVANGKKSDSINNFRKITGTTPLGAILNNSATPDYSVEEFNRKANEGHVYKLIAQSISTLKQIDRICDFALSNKNKYPNSQYYENLKENAQVALELLNKPPFNDELSV